MGDVHDKATRSFNMSRVQSRDTKPEIRLRRSLFSKGFRYKLHDKKLPGKPDIVLPKYRTVILVHGCFWHQHKGCKKARLPIQNAEFWKAKLQQNVSRDAKSEKALRDLGWNVLIVWECETQKSIKETLERVSHSLTSVNHA